MYACDVQVNVFVLLSLPVVEVYLCASIKAAQEVD
jgi:hypothetical protein